jgi:hypothetical protein
MRLKIAAICPACQSPHPDEVEPGVKVTCPDCDEVYRAEVPEVAPTTARARAAAKKAAPAKKKPRTKGADKLGKLIEVFSPAQKRALIMTVAIAAGVIGAGVMIFALVGTDPDVQPWVLGGGGVLVLIAVLRVLLLRFGGLGDVFEVRKNGVRYKTRKAEQFLFWEEMETIDIRREVETPGNMKYEIYLIGSETIHLTPAFLKTLDDPRALIKALKRYSGKDFETAVG